MRKNTSRRMAGAHSDRVSEVVKHIQKESLSTPKVLKVEWIPQLLANQIKDFLVKKCGLRMDESSKLSVLADNSQFKACLEAIVALGRSAESDLQNIQQENSKTSGQELSCSTSTDVLDQNVVRQAVREKNDNLDLSKGTPWEDFEKAQDVVRKDLQTLNLNASKISSMKNHLSEMMDCFRHDQAWRLAKLAHEKDYDEAFKELHSIFKEIFMAIRRDNSQNPDELINLEKEILECAWIWEKQPPLSVIKEDMDLQIRILGVDFKEPKSCKIYAFRESDCTRELPPKSVSNLKVESTSGGIIVSGKVKLILSKVKLNSSNFYKRGSSLLFEDFWRIVWQIEESWGSIKCLSAPFTVRTGAPQLWSHTGAVVWYIWSVKDLYKTPFVCPKEMKFSSALSMLQALVSVACPKLEFSQDEKEILLITLKSLNRKPGTPQDKLSMAGFVHDGMPVQGIRAALEGTEKKPAQFSCFCWFSGTVNSLKLLQDYDACSRIFYLGFCQCEKILKEKEKGSCILRFSQNLVVNCQSMNPNVTLIVQIQGFKKMHSVPLEVKSLEGKSLYTTLKSIKCDGIDIILPETVTAPHREGKLIECYKTRYREGPPQRDIVDFSKEFERMTVDSPDVDFSDFSSSASCSTEPPRTDNFWANSAAPFDSPDVEGNPEPPSKAPKLSFEIQANGENMEDLDDIDTSIDEPVPADAASLNDLLNNYGP